MHQSPSTQAVAGRLQRRGQSRIDVRTVEAGEGAGQAARGFAAGQRQKRRRIACTGPNQQAGRPAAAFGKDAEKYQRDEGR
jgi:hypothetical protein